MLRFILETNSCETCTRHCWWSPTLDIPLPPLFSCAVTDPPLLGFTDSKVGRLEEALSAARREVAEASAASERARARRDEAEARIVRLDAAKLETAREV